MFYLQLIESGELIAESVLTPEVGDGFVSLGEDRYLGDGARLRIVERAAIDRFAPNRFRLVDGELVELTPPPPVMPSEADYVMALEAYYDAKAKERRYDNRLTCALRAGYAGPFQAEGAAFAVWMDTCNALAYQIMGAVLAGDRAQPTVDELIAELPALEWPA